MYPRVNLPLTLTQRQLNKCPKPYINTSPAQTPQVFPQAPYHYNHLAKKFTLSLSHTFQYHHLIQENQIQANTQLRANYKLRERTERVGFREREREWSVSERKLRESGQKSTLIMEVEKGTKMGFEETELRLGLPGNGGGAEGEMVRKRGFSETVDLKLKLSSKESGADPNHEKTSSLQREKNLLATDPAKPPAK